MAEDKKDQTTDPTKGQGQEGQQTTGTDDLQAKLDALQKDLQKKDREAKVNQARADRAEAALQAGAATSAGATGRTASSVLQRQQLAASRQQQQQLAQPAQQQELQNQELLYLRELTRRGLNPEDIDPEMVNEDGSYNFSGADDLRTKLELLQQKKEIQDLRASLELKVSAEGEGPSGPRVDTGGPTGTEGQTQVQVDKLLDSAKDLRKKGMYREATWVALRAAHTDPAKRLPVRGQPSEE